MLHQKNFEGREKIYAVPLPTNPKKEGPMGHAPEKNLSEPQNFLVVGRAGSGLAPFGVLSEISGESPDLYLCPHSPQGRDAESWPGKASPPTYKGHPGGPNWSRGSKPFSMEFIVV